MAGETANAAPASDAGSSEAELAQYEAPIVPAQAGNCGPSPIYIVCSPSRQVGKTLLARLLAEHYLAEGRPLAAVDLADEGPRLSDFLPDHTRIANIDDVQGQMQLFDGLLEDNTMVKVIDVSYRAFKSFFSVASKINLFGEARRRSIEPLILFLIDPDPDTAKAYAWLRQRFKERRCCRCAISSSPRDCRTARLSRTPARLRCRSKFPCSVLRPDRWSRANASRSRRWTVTPATERTKSCGLGCAACAASSARSSSA